MHLDFPSFLNRPTTDQPCGLLLPIRSRRLRGRRTVVRSKVRGHRGRGQQQQCPGRPPWCVCVCVLLFLLGQLRPLSKKKIKKINICFSYVCIFFTITKLEDEMISVFMLDNDNYIHPYDCLMQLQVKSISTGICSFNKNMLSSLINPSYFSWCLKPIVKKKANYMFRWTYNYTDEPLVTYSCL